MRKLILITLFWHCATKLIHPTSADVERARQWYPEVDSLTLVTGMKLYKAKCGQCHRPIHPGTFTAREWIRHVNEFSDEAKLSDNQKLLIIIYVQTFSKDRFDYSKYDAKKQRRKRKG
ncbi:MAG: hypothetical protein GXO48_05690 [Chlorobi bacterium]|nr:hypothetical protein [Chlorobiota bacterium]